MSRIDVYQALWGMQMLPTPENPRTVDESLKMIEEAGFDGALNYIDDLTEETLQESYRISELINTSGLKLGMSCHGNDLQDMKNKIDYTVSVGGEFLNIMVRDYYIYGDEAIRLLDAVITYGKEKGLKVFIETHRGTVTQDLIRTTQYVDALPEMKLTTDLSHYVVSCEIEFPDDKVEAHFDKLLQRMASMHIRISNGEQVQLPLNRVEEHTLDNFMRWWKKGIGYWEENAGPDDRLPVVVELGPLPYQQKILVDGQWVFDCDRWNEALIWKSVVKDF